MKQRALESTRFVLKHSRYGYAEGVRGCAPKAKRLCTGKPFFIRTLIHPSKEDLERLQQHIHKIQRQEPDFVASRVSDFLYDYQDAYRIPIFDRDCGYLFHITLKPNSREPLFVGTFHPLSLREAQKRMNAENRPTFVWFHTSLSPLREGYLWVADSKAVKAFDEHTIYQIVDRSGKPVSPLETKLTPQIFRESFVTSMGDPSAYWHFRLPVRLEPLPVTP